MEQREKTLRQKQRREGLAETPAAPLQPSERAAVSQREQADSGVWGGKVTGSPQEHPEGAGPCMHPDFRISGHQN